MFILRQITNTDLEYNFILGESYHLIQKDDNLKSFNELLNLLISNDSYIESNDISEYAILVYNNNQSHKVLEEDSYYYIMTSDGKTFANITSTIKKYKK